MAVTSMMGDILTSVAVIGHLSPLSSVLPYLHSELSIYTTSMRHIRVLSNVHGKIMKFLLVPEVSKFKHSYFFKYTISIFYAF